MQTAILCYVQPLNNGICTAYEYILRLPFSVTPIRILSVNETFRNLGQIQFIAESSSIYRKNLLAPKVSGLLEKFAESFLYNFHHKHILLKLKIKKLLRKKKYKNLSAGVFLVPVYNYQLLRTHQSLSQIPPFIKSFRRAFVRCRSTSARRKRVTKRFLFFSVFL